MSDELEKQGTAIPIDLYALVDGLRKRLIAERENLPEIAPEIGVTYAGLNQFRNGTRAMPTIETLQKLCDYYAITVDVATHRHVMAPVVRPIS